jgi:hypothetical protein
VKAGPHHLLLENKELKKSKVVRVVIRPAERKVVKVYLDE